MNRISYKICHYWTYQNVCDIAGKFSAERRL